MKAEEYEAAVDALLKALGLDPVETLEVHVEPHQATAKVLVLDEDEDGKKKRQRTEDGRVKFTEVVVKRDDAGMSVDLSKFNNIKPGTVLDAINKKVQGIN